MADSNLGMSLFFVGPYVLFAVSTLIVRRQRATVGRLMLVAVFCAMGVLAGWIDHDQYLRMPLGRETTPMLNFLATFALWFVSIIVLAAAAISRFLNTRSPNSL